MLVMLQCKGSSRVYSQRSTLEVLPLYEFGADLLSGKLPVPVCWRRDSAQRLHLLDVNLQCGTICTGTARCV